MICFHKSSLFVAVVIVLAAMSFMVLAKNGEDHALGRKKSATLSYSFVGMLLKGNSDDSYWPHCSATLISPDHVLTARHCVRYLHGYGLKVFFPFEGIREIAQDGVTVFCEQSNNHCSKRLDDLALIELSTPYSTLPTARLGNLSNMGAGNEKTIVGFGLEDGSLFNNGIKREGRVVLDQCRKCTATNIPDKAPSNNHQSLCFNFSIQGAHQDGLNVIGNQHGDSGGPMLGTSFESHLIVGVAREVDWTCSNGYQREGQYVDLSSSRYHDWLSDAFCDPSCGANSEKHVKNLLEIELARLDRDDTQDDYQIDIQPGAKRLIITMNHEVGGWDPEPSDLDVLLDMNAECTRYIGVEVCTVNKPVSGSHTVSVKRIHKSAAYQLAAIAIYTAHSTPQEKTPATGGK